VSVILLMAAGYRHSDGCVTGQSGSMKAWPVCCAKNPRSGQPVRSLTHL